MSISQSSDCKFQNVPNDCYQVHLLLLTEIPKTFEITETQQNPQIFCTHCKLYRITKSIPFDPSLQKLTNVSHLCPSINKTFNCKLNSKHPKCNEHNDGCVLLISELPNEFMSECTNKLKVHRDYNYNAKNQNEINTTNMNSRNSEKSDETQKISQSL